MSDTLEVTPRKATGTRESRRLRRQGLVPAILYGHGEKCVGLAAKREAVQAVIRHGSRIVELKGAVKESALIRELQWDTYGVEPIHLDLLRVSKSDRIKVKVPIDMKGEEAAAVPGAAEPELIGRKPAEEGEGEAAQG